MARTRTVYRCAACGHTHPRWTGRCEDCGAWNSVAEEASGVGRPPAGRVASADGVRPVALRDIPPERLARWTTGIAEFDFVLGGGLVPGSLVLIGGEPGVGKSTLLLQACARFETAGLRTLYASGEESPEQIRLRADRLAPDAGAVLVLGATQLETVLAAARACRARVLVLDSIHTVYTERLEGVPGSVGQVRESAALLMRFAKETDTAVLIVGHVTKAGGIAGPKTLEHIVDTVLTFDGEPAGDYRLLRATKNRFGSVHELGVFTMTASGLVPVANPSAAFLAARASGAVGSAVTAVMEGSRPVLVEVQALAAPSSYGTPQRVATGLDPRRLAVILAVLERRASVSFADQDVFVQVAGGLRLGEPAADLALAAALLSSRAGRPTLPDALYLGELGLSGDIRPVTGLDRRLGEAARLGFRLVFAAGRPGVLAGEIRQVSLSVVEEVARTLAG